MARNRRPIVRFEGVAELERRALLTGLVIDPIADTSVPALKTRIIPLTATDTAGKPVTYTVQSDNPSISARVITNTVDVKLSIQDFGDITLKLIPEFAPVTVGHISDFVTSGFYNGLTFHRVVSNFVNQGGDPQGNGTGGPGFQYDDEFNPDAIFSGDGQVAMANSGDDTNGSQFFLTVGAQRFLDFDYTLFGQIVRGLDVNRAINAVAKDANDKPLTPVVIKSATIVHDTSDAILVIKSTAAGTAHLTVSASDTDGAQDQKVFNVATIADTQNDPPILGPVPASVVTAVGQPINVTLSSTDLEGDAVTYATAIVSNPPNGVASINGNVLTVTPTAGFVGDITVKVGVRQAVSPTRFDTQSITVSVKNQVLSLTAASPTIQAGATATLTFANFTAAVPYDASNYTALITWADNSTSNAQVVPGANGSYDVKLSVSRNVVDLYDFTVRVTDVKNNKSASAIGDLDVVDAPLTVAFVPISPNAGTRTVSGTVGTLVDGNPSRPAGDLVATINWGDGSGPVQATLVSKGNGRYDITGSKTYAARGAYTVVVAVVDRDGGTANDRGSIVVPNLAPGLTAIPDKQVDEGATLAFDVVATDTDAGQKLTYSLLPGAPDGATIDPNTGAFSWTPDVGPQSAQVTVKVVDDGTPSLSDTKTFTINVANVKPIVTAGPSKSVLQGDPYVGSGSFTDHGVGPWTATVDYGDGSGETPLTLNADKTFTLLHIYNAPGDVTITVNVFENGLPADPGTTTVAVQVVGVIPVVSAGPAGNISEGAAYTGSGSFLTAGSGPWSGLVDYGDGTGDVTLTLNADKTFDLSHVYATPGDYTITVKIADAAFPNEPGTKTVAVKVNSLAPVVTAGPPATIGEGSTYTDSGSFTDPGPGPWTATVDYDDGFGAVPLTLNADKTFALSHLYELPGSYLVKIRVTSDAHPSESGAFDVDVTVNAVAPVVTLGQAATINESTTYTGTGSFTDPGVGPWTATVDYGDGSGSQALSLNADKTFALSHLYAKPGDYTLRVTVLEGAASALSGTNTVVVKVTNVVPTITLPSTATTSEGSAFTVQGSFTDPGVGPWTARVDYGDGLGSIPLTLRADKTFTLSKIYTTAGDRTVKVFLTDAAAPAKAETKTLVVSVAGVAPVLNVPASGVAKQLDTYAASGSFSDPGGNTWAGVVDYGDGTGTTPLTILADKTFPLSHQYQLPGVYTVTVTVIDTALPNQPATKTFPVTVSNVVPTVLPGGGAVVRQYDTFVRQGSFSDAGAGTWTATVDYGDGTGVQPLGLGADHSFKLAHVYATPGNFTATVVVTDQYGASGAASFPASVALYPLTAIRQAWRSVSKGRVTVSLTFEGDLETTRMLKAANYRIVNVGRDGVLGTKDDVSFAFSKLKVVGNTVTLTPKGRLPALAGKKLVVSNLLDRHGRPLFGSVGGSVSGTFNKFGVVDLSKK